MKHHTTLLLFSMISIWNINYLQASYTNVYWNSPKFQDGQKNLETAMAIENTIVRLDTIDPDTAQEMETDYLEIVIPELMHQRKLNIAANPVHLTNQNSSRPLWSTTAGNITLSLSTDKISSGNAYNALCHIIGKEDLFKNYPITLRYEYESAGRAAAMFSSILLGSTFDDSCDALKNFILQHELAHHYHGDTQTNSHIITNEIVQLARTEQLKSFLKNSKNKTFISAQIKRYKECNADLRAVEKTECFDCLTEVNIYMKSRDSKSSESKGYFTSQQIAEIAANMKAKNPNTCCLHHHRNGRKIDLSITDGSTMLDRLTMVKKD